MPHASELEEFGLEVEQENHSLITPARTKTNLSIPPKEQRLRLQSTNVRRKSGGVVILKLASLLLALTIVVRVHVGKESEETEYIEEEELMNGNKEICVDDPKCADYIKQAGNLRSSSSCNEPIGILNEQQYQKLLKHYCRRSCGLCGSGIIDEEEGCCY